jgi:hypothetical protein
MSSYSYWYGIASGSGASALAAITDNTTDCNEAYWIARGYDQIRALFVQLGTAPGSGVDGNFSINQDASGNETSTLTFYTNGALEGSDPYLRWDSAATAFRLNQNLITTSDLGATGTRIPNVYATAINASGTITTANVDASGTLDVDGTSTLADVTVSGTLSAATLSLTGNIETDGTQLVFNDDYAGSSPSENATVEVERGTLTNAALRWNETNDVWEAYNTGAAAYNIIALLNASGFTSSNVFAGSGGNYGTAAYAARSDHNHSGGSLNATGTDETTWRIDEDYTSGSVNIECQFGAAGNYIRYNPGAGDPQFVFSDDISTANLTASSAVTAASASITGDLTLSGAIDSALRIDGDSITLNDDLAGAPSGNISMIANRGSSTDVDLRWNETDDQWEYTNNGTDYFYLVGADDATGDIAAPNDLTVTGDLIGDVRITGDELILRQDESSGGDATITVNRGAADRYFRWNETSGIWQFHDGSSGSPHSLVGVDKTQTLTAKTLTSPSISNPTISSGGTWSGSPIFSGTPSFTGLPAFNYSLGSGPPFAVHYTLTGVVTNLNADQVDSYNATDFIRKSGSDYVLDADLDLNGNSIIGSTVSTHASSHMTGQSDELSGTFGSGVSGTNASTWTIEADDVYGTLQLGNSGSYYVNVPYAGWLGLGGSDVDAVPGSSSVNQDIGNNSRRWRNGFFQHHINLNQNASSSSFTDYGDGSIWSASGTPQSLVVQLDSTEHTVADGNGKTGLSGSTGGWSVAGDITVTGTVDSIDIAGLATTVATNSSAISTALQDADFSSNGLMSRTGAGTYSIVTDNSSNWNTAYGWGNHAGVYIPIGATFGGDVSGTYDAIVVANDSHSHSDYLPLAGGAMSGVLNMNNQGLLNTALITMTPVNPATPLDGYFWLENGSPDSLRVNISSTEHVIVDGNGKTGLSGSTGGWSVAGDITVTGTVDSVDIAGLSTTVASNSSALSTALQDADFSSNGIMKRTGAGAYGIVTDNSSNWDTAYGWGNHASGGYYSASGGTISGAVTLSGGKLALTGAYNLEIKDSQSIFFDGSTGDYYINKFSSSLALGAGGSDQALLTSTYLALAGDLKIASGNKAIFDSGTDNNYMMESGGYLYAIGGGTNSFALNSTDAYFYDNVRVQQGNKLYLDWDSETYFTFNGTTVSLYVNGVSKETWS